MFICTDHGWHHSSFGLSCLQCCCSKASTSPLRARLLALPWKRPFFPAPFPWRISNTLESTDSTIIQHACALRFSEWRLHKYMVMNLTAAQTQPLIRLVQPAQTNQVPSPLRQSGKLTFPRSKPNWA